MLIALVGIIVASVGLNPKEGAQAGRKMSLVWLFAGLLDLQAFWVIVSFVYLLLQGASGLVTSVWILHPVIHDPEPSSWSTPAGAGDKPRCQSGTGLSSSHTGASLLLLLVGAYDCDLTARSVNFAERSGECVMPLNGQMSDQEWHGAGTVFEYSGLPAVGCRSGCTSAAVRAFSRHIRDTVSVQPCMPGPDV